MPVTPTTDFSQQVHALPASELIRTLECEIEEVRAKPALWLEACVGKPLSELERSEWDCFRTWHLSTRGDGNLAAIFRSYDREIEESVELFFMDLASASETYSGDFFNEDTHDSFYLAAREVNSQGLRIQLGFLKDNAPSVYEKLLGKAGLTFVLPR